METIWKQYGNNMKLAHIIIPLIGLGFGSFASVIIHRIHSEEGGILFGRSKCPKCKKTLGAIDLIPIAGYMINKFKCRFCKDSISIRYPILEIVMGLGFLSTSLLVGFNNYWLLAYYLLITFIFVLLSFYDIFFQEIPDRISLPTIILTGLVGFIAHLHSPKHLVIGFIIPVVFFGALFLGSRGRWLGGGDVRIGAIMGFILGWPNIIIGLFLAYLFGSIYSIIGLLSGKLTRKTPIPFGPFLFIGTYIALFWGKNIVGWYLGMI